MLYCGLDLSRKRIDFHLLDVDGRVVEVGAVGADGDALAGLARRVGVHGLPVLAAVESMNGARFVHDELERHGWEVLVADAAKVRGFAPVACKTDKVDARVLAELAQKALVPAIWLPGLEVRGARERARFRLHLVRHRVSLKNRIHQTLVSFGVPCPVSDMFGVQGRERLERLQLPDPWAGTVQASLRLLDDLAVEIDSIERELRELGADHPYVPLLTTVPGIAWVLGYTIAAEIGDIHRFATPAKLAGYSGLCPRVYQSGASDRRGPISKTGPKYLRWALLEATTHACRHPAYNERYQRTKTRLGRQRGPKVAQIDLARRLSHAVWHMLTRNQPFAPAGATPALAA
jgi:transposase